MERQPDITSLETQVTTLNNQISALTTEKYNIINQAAILAQEKVALNTQVIDLNVQVTALIQERDNLINQVVTMSQDKIALNTQISNLTTQKDNVSNQVTTLNQEKAILIAQVNDLTGQVRTRIQDNENQAAQIETLIQDNSKQNRTIITLEKQNKVLVDIREKCIAETKKLRQSNEEQNSELARLKMQLEASNKEINKYQVDFKKLEKLAEQIEQENHCLRHEKVTKEESFESLQNLIQTLQTKIESLKEERAEMLIKYKKDKNIDENKEMLQFRENRVSEEDFRNYYDCRVVADSFYTLLLKKPWQVEFKNYADYQVRSQEKTSRVAVLGYEKTGKSFVLSKLTGRELPQGKHTKTSGVCVLYPTEENLPWMALDTPGTNLSVKTELMKEKIAEHFKDKKLPEEEKMRMLLGDNILMENLLQQFVVTEAQVLLVVIGKLRRDDQRLISRIKSLPGKRILVIHNLLETRDIADVEKIIQEDIIETFAVNDRIIHLDKVQSSGASPINKKVYLEINNKLSGQDKFIEHVIMAHEGSAAGNYYNESAITYIRNTITTTPFTHNFDLVEAFSKHLNENIRQYLSSKDTVRGDSFILNKDPNDTPLSLTLSDSEQYDLKLSSANEFGQIKTFAREGLTDVPHTTKIITHKTDEGVEDKKFLQVEFEIVGTCDNNDIKYKVRELGNNQIKIEIRGKSEDNTMREETEDIIESTRKFGDFTISTESIELEGYVIDRGEKAANIDTIPGLKILSWKLKPEISGFF